MIRLAVHGAKSRWQALTARLRGGSINGSLDTCDLPLSPDSYDAVLWIAPTQQETALIERALAQGKHVLIASATELSPTKLVLLAAAAKRAGVQLGIVNPDRFLPSRQLLRQQLEAGKLGQAGLIRMYRWEAAAARSLSGTPPAVPSPLVLDLDLAIWLMGMTPHVVYATQARRLPQGTDREPMIQVHLGFPNGSMALLGYSSSLPPGDDYRSLSVMGSAGAAYADDHQNMQLIYRGQHPQALRAEEGIRPLVNLTQDFIEALQSSRDLSSSIADWSRLVSVTRAVAESLLSRQAISMEGS